jgi:uncharacterized protein with FMN-binding domain
VKRKINSFINISMLLAFLACGITGILKLPELNIAFSLEGYVNTSLLHDWSGIIGFVLIMLHVVLHARWFSALTRIIFNLPNRRKPVIAKITAKPSRTSGIINAIVFIAVLFFAQSNSFLWAGGSRHFSNATVPQGIDYQVGSLKDGTYTGTANGYMPSLTVNVIIKNGVINAIKVASHGETMRWYDAVVNVIPKEIINSQSTDIDAVSGATSSSYGIMSAVEDALKKAAK